MAIEIVDFPIKNGGSFHSFLYVYQRVTKILGLTPPGPLSGPPSAPPGSMPFTMAPFPSGRWVTMPKPGEASYGRHGEKRPWNDTEDRRGKTKKKNERKKKHVEL